MVFENIVEDLLQNKCVLVISETLTFIELQIRLKEIYEDVVLLNLVFCDSSSIIEERDRFDSVYNI